MSAMTSRLAILRAGLLLGVLVAPCAPTRAQQSTRAVPVIEVRQKAPEVLGLNEVLPLEVVLTNTGTTPAESLTVTDSLPPGFELLDSTPPAERERQTLRWSLGRLEPGAQRVLRLRVAAREDLPRGEIWNQVEVTARASVTDRFAVVVRRPELSVSVSGPDTASVGEKALFRFTIRNDGTCPAPNVTLETLLPDALEHVCGPDLENDLGTLAPGESRTVPLELTPKRAGEVRSRFSVHARGAATVEHELALRVKDLRLRVEARGPTLLYLNYAGSYEVAITNAGPEALEQVGLQAALPDGISFARASDNAVYVPDSHAIRWDLGTLRPGESRTLVWNGTATKVGDLKCNLTVLGGARQLRELHWTTRVAQPPAGN
jgi:uncharacterized repeat protein (TIGR01451 family)